MTDTGNHNQRKLNKRELLIAEGFIPPWLDMGDMCLVLPISPNTVDNWVAQGILPPPRKRGGKLMWKWSEVDAKLEGGTGTEPDSQAERVRNATRKAHEARASY